MQWIHVGAGTGAFLACAAIGAFTAVVVFGDLIIKSDNALRKTMDAILLAALSAVAAVAFTLVAVAYRVCPLTPSAGI